jgi:hypothetical protein
MVITASGYGVQPAQASPALELAVQRCGGELYFDGTGAKAVFQVRFSLARRDAQNGGTVSRLVPDEAPADPDRRLADR